LDRSCKQWVSITWSEEQKENATCNKRRKANLIDHILCRKCLLKHVTEGKNGRKEVRRRQGRRRKQLLDDSKETIGYWNLKQEALHRNLWRTGFGKGYGPVLNV
jgi:hypothetical protein